MDIHIAGPEPTNPEVDDSQRCATCGYLLVDVGESDGMGFWPPGRFVAVTGERGVNRRMRTMKDATAARQKEDWCKPAPGPVAGGDEAERSEVLASSK